MTVSPEVAVRVRGALAEIEREESCKVCLAVESGSRAWGFASTDSDYDVRFIYVRRPDWYLSIDVEDKRDVIERPLNDELDLSGWDLRKALRLLRKSNPPLLEWLQCRIIYLERPAIAERIRSLLPTFYSPRATFHHYLHMAQGNFRDYLHGDVVWRKKYFYALRPVLAMRWIERDLGPVPIEFERLLDATVELSELRTAIDGLLIEKRAGAELDRGPRSAPISDFLETEIARLESEAAKRPVVSPGGEALDECFRDVLYEVWTEARTH
jgi:uncharacterized protein